ncbi:MAG: outer membrane lipid asymmetry maintenance protein MlaD [Pseudomonadales bacterium]
MQLRTIEIVVGAFMLAGLISLAILAFQVSGFNVGAQTGTYSVYARFENVGGLVRRAKVSVGGVIVGQVADIELDQKTFTAVVRMEIDEEVDQLPMDTAATILTEGLLGGKYVGLSIGAEEELLKDGDEIVNTQSALVLEELIGEFIRKAF